MEPADRITELVNQRTNGASEKRLVKLSSVIDEGTKSPASAKIRSACRNELSTSQYRGTRNTKAMRIIRAVGRIRPGSTQRSQSAGRQPYCHDRRLA